MTESIIVGIDPGAKGGIAILGPGPRVRLIKTPDTDQDLVDYIRSAGATFAVLEQMQPRPTYWVSSTLGPQRSILKSTVLLYGRYSLARGVLSALRIPTEEVLPQHWQKLMRCGRQSKESRGSAEHKRALKQKAEQLFPGTKGLTLQTCDALLLAEFGRRIQTGAAAPQELTPTLDSGHDDIP